MKQKYTNDTMFQYYKDLDEDLAWLTQKAEESKCKKANFTPAMLLVEALALNKCLLGEMKYIYKDFKDHYTITC